MTACQEPDVLVVGGGPAGATAAQTCASKGLETLLVDASAAGAGVSGAQGIGSYLFPLVPFSIPDRFFNWRIKGIQFNVDDVTISQTRGFYNGWRINRGVFDEWLRTRAQQAGATVYQDCSLEGLSYDALDTIRTATLNHGGESISVSPSYVIAADGAPSTVGRLLDVHNTDIQMGHAHAWEMHDIDLECPHMEQMYFGDYAPGAYAYVFPKSEQIASVGVATIGDDSQLAQQFDRFSSEVIPGMMADATRAVNRSGTVPVGDPVSKSRYGNVLFVGDAANQNLKPYAEGILPAIICGDLAGRAIGKGRPEAYPTMIEQKLGGLFKESARIRTFMNDLRTVDGPKKHLLSAYLFAYLDIEGVKTHRTSTVETIKTALRDQAGGLNRLRRWLGYALWRSKATVTGHD